jgi:hypothetical protein
MPMIRRSVLVMGIVASISSCVAPGADPPSVLDRTTEKYEEAPLALPQGSEFEFAESGSIARDEQGRVVAIEMWIGRRGEELSAAERVCFGRPTADVLSVMPSCPPKLTTAGEVAVYADAAKLGLPADAKWAEAKSEPNE